MAKDRRGRPRPATPEEELSLAYGQSLLQALVPAYDAWRTANAGKCAKSDIVQALLYFAGGTLAELAEGEPPERWLGYVTAVQVVLGEAMTFAREAVRRRQK